MPYHQEGPYENPEFGTCSQFQFSTRCHNVVGYVVSDEMSLARHDLVQEAGDRNGEDLVWGDKYHVSA